MSKMLGEVSQCLQNHKTIQTERNGKEAEKKMKGIPLMVPEVGDFVWFCCFASTLHHFKQLLWRYSNWNNNYRIFWGITSFRCSHPNLNRISFDLKSPRFIIRGNQWQAMQVFPCFWISLKSVGIGIAKRNGIVHSVN